jgi:hypothetical protein
MNTYSNSNSTERSILSLNKSTTELTLSLDDNPNNKFIRFNFDDFKEDKKIVKAKI